MMRFQLTRRGVLKASIAAACFPNVAIAGVENAKLNSPSTPENDFGGTGVGWPAEFRGCATSQFSSKIDVNNGSADRSKVVSSFTQADTCYDIHPDWV